MAVTAHDGAQHSSAARSATKFRLARRSEENRRACSSPFHRALQLDRTGQNCYPTCPAQAYLDRCGQTTGSSLQRWRSEEHTSELQSRQYLVCRLLLEKKKKNKNEKTHVATKTEQDLRQ